MMEAEVGDDVWNEDPTVQELERYAAEISGKEAALFVPTATMSNLIAVTNHCTNRDSEVLVGDKAHIHVFEQGAISTWGHVHSRTVHTNVDGTLSLSDLESKMRDSTNVHFPVSKLICLENTHNLLGGCVIPLEHIADVRKIADKYQCKMHLDGARVFHASIYLDVSLRTILENFDSASLCLSKGLGAPIGSILVGSKDFIYQARRSRKALGGGMRQVGVIAAPCMIALRDMPSRLVEDHINARLIGEAINAQKDTLGLEVNMETLHTNIVIANPVLGKKPLVSPTDFCKMLQDKKFLTFNYESVIVKCAPIGSGIRFVTHYDVTRELTLKAIEKLNAICMSLTNQTD